MMTRKHLYYAILNTIVNIVFFLILIIAMFTEILTFSLLVMIVGALGVQPEPGVTFNFVSFVLDISPIIFITSIIGTWITYFKDSKKYFRLFIMLTWIYMIIVSLGYVILYLIES